MLAWSPVIGAGYELRKINIQLDSSLGRVGDSKHSPTPEVEQNAFVRR
jgi:hypothetical protein